MKLRSHIGEMMAFPRDELERNYVCVESGDHAERLANIEAMPSAMLRQIEASLLELSEEHPVGVGKLLRLKAEGTGLHYAGAGTESTAVTDEENVWKIHRKSVHWAEKDRREKAYQDREDHMVMVRHMGEFMVRELTTVEQHPLRPRKRAVITRQEYLDFTSTGIFTAYKPEIDEDAIEELIERYPGVAGSLSRFAALGLEMHAETGMLVDSSGLNNIVMAERDGAMRLTCLDGTPVKQNNASVAERIVGQLTALQEFVAP